MLLAHLASRNFIRASCAFLSRAWRGKSRSWFSDRGSTRRTHVNGGSVCAHVIEIAYAGVGQTDPCNIRTRVNILCFLTVNVDALLFWTLYTFRAAPYRHVTAGMTTRHLKAMSRARI